MRPPIPISELKILGGNTALDFVNTVGAWTNGLERDSFESARHVLDWAKRLAIIEASEARAFQRIVDAEPDIAAKLLREVRKLRLVVHAVFDAIAAQKTPSKEAFEALAAAAERAQGRRKLVSTRDGAEWVWNGDDPMTIVDRLAHAAAELATNAPALRIKACPGHACGWLFIDTSRNGKRRWCSEADCGTRARVKAFRERKAEDR